MAEERQLCTFFLDGQDFGLDVLRVQEVIRGQATTRVPLAPTVVRGLMNLRGQIVTALDLRERLGLPARSTEASAVNVVVQTGDGAVSLIVDEIGDVVTVSPQAFEPPPDTVLGPARELILGAYKLPGRLLLALDLDHTLEANSVGNTERR